MKVFVLINRWSYDYEIGNDVLVFKTREEAVKAMKEGYEDFVKREYEEDGTFNVAELYDNSAEVYQEGWYTQNHCAWHIFEREL